MNTVLKNRFLVGASLVSMMFGAVSCVDDTGLKVTAEAPNADKTIYEIIINDKELSNFVEVLDSCNLPGGVSVADSLFNHSRVYTLWAPTNKALDNDMKDSILNRIKDKGGRDDVMRTFVESHIANNLHPAKGRYDERELVLMLNNKKVAFEGSYKTLEDYPYSNGYKFGDNYLCSVNDRAWNGIIHRLDATSKYRYNIWEVMTEVAAPDLFGHSLGIDSVVKFLYSYNDTVFSPGASTLGPIEDGEQTYLDSVFVNSNVLLNNYSGIGAVDSEDSVYTLYVPTNRLWNEFMEKYEAHFAYDINAKTKPQNMDEEYLDSIKYLYPRLYMVKYLSFSNKENEKHFPGDSLVTANLDKGKERLRFSKNDLAGCEASADAQYKKLLSNGYLKVIDKLPFDIFDLWHDTIKIEGEDNTMVTVDDGTYTRPAVYKDQVRRDHPDFRVELSGSRYIDIQPTTGGSKVEVTFKLPNVRAASYKVAVITIPSDLIEAKEFPEDKPTLNVTAFNQGSYDPLVNGNLTDKYDLSYERVDTVVLLDKNKDEAVFRFPKCEFYNTYAKEHFVATMSLKTSRGRKSNADVSLRIDQILLIPVEDVE